MDLHGKVGGIIGAVTGTKCGKHVAFCGDAESGTSSLDGLFLDVQPEIPLAGLDLLPFRVALDLFEDPVDLFKFQVNDVIHHPLGFVDMRDKKFRIEAGFGGEGLVDVIVKVDRQQAAAVVGTERNFTAGICGNRMEAKIGVAVGNRFPQHGIPEQDAGFGRFPGVVHDLRPELPGLDGLGELGRIGIDGEALNEIAVTHHRLHEFVGKFYGDVGARYFAGFEFCVDEMFGIGMYHRDAEHQRPAASLLGHLAGGVGVALHEGYDPRGGKRAVPDFAVFRPDVRQVMSYTAPALHQLHLLLVGLHDGSVRVGGSVIPDHETVGERTDLEAVADPGHRASLGNDVAETLQQVENLLFAHRVRVLLLNPCYFPGNAVMHVIRSQFEKMPLGILQGVFVGPHVCSKTVTVEINGRFFNCFTEQVNFSFWFLCPGLFHIHFFIAHSWPDSFR